MKPFCIGLFCFLFIELNAQNKSNATIGKSISINSFVADSLERTLEHASNPNKLILYKQLTWHYRQQDINKAKKYADLGIGLAEQEKDLFSKADFLRFKALIGLFYEYNADAAKYLDQSIALSENLNYVDGLAFCYDVLSTIYIESNNLSEAFIYSKKSYHLFLQSNNLEGLIYANNHLGQFYFKKNIIDSSILYVKKALNFAKQKNDSAQICYQYNLLAKYYLSTRQLDSATNYLIKSNIIANGLESKHYQIDNYNLQSKIYVIKNSFDTAIFYALNALQLANVVNYIKGKEEASYSLFSSYKQQGQTDMALKMLMLHDSCQDIQNTYQLSQQVASSTLSYIYKQKILYEEINNKNKTSTIWGLLFVVFFLIAASLFWKRKILKENLLEQKKQNIIVVNVLDELTEKNNLIETKNKELEKSLQLNEKILHLISHNFRAPLTNIQSLFLLYRDKDINSQEFNEFIPTLLKNTNNGLIILDNLLYWSGLEKSKDLTETCIISVVPTVEHQIKKIAAELDEKKITLVCKCNELVYVEFNSALFEIIIRNILLLCVTNSKSNTTIHVYIKPSSRNIEFEFIYKGYKLLTDDLEKIETFEIDFSEQNLIYSMGLFICKKYIDAAGGIFTIDYSATNENSIHILLPRFNMK